MSNQTKGVCRRGSKPKRRRCLRQLRVRHIGPYVLERRLGEGTYGVVWRARVPGQTCVALKCFKDDELFDHDKFMRAAQLGAFSVDAVCLPTTCCAVTHKSKTVYVLSMPIAVPLAWKTIDIMAAKAVLHFPARLFKMGLVHNDISPANIVRYNNQYRLADTETCSRDSDGDFYGTFRPWEPNEEWWPEGCAPETIDTAEAQRALTLWGAIGTAVALCTGLSDHVYIWRHRKSLLEAVTEHTGPKIVNALMAEFDAAWARLRARVLTIRSAA